MNYDKDDVLGSGFFGTVFRGTFSGDHVAIKRVQLVHLDIREEEAMSKLSHPNVIRLLDTREEGEFK
jgi:serine/threonine protein kinase